jgi:hypothetical protein
MAPKISKARMSALGARSAEAKRQKKDERERLQDTIWTLLVSLELFRALDLQSWAGSGVSCARV